jgi:ABC-type branched-subunit amino acid transport system substrate-binding protein
MGFVSKRHRSGILLSALVALALVATGCGSSSSSSSTKTAAADNTAAGATATAAAGAKASGSPYIVGEIDDNPVQPEPDIFATLQAEAKQINAAGGVNGHPIQVIHCSGQLNPNSTTVCARQFVANSSMLATVGNFEANGAGATQILDAGGLGQLGNFATVPADFSCHSCFPFGIDSLSDLGMATALVDVDHASKVGWAWIDVPAARAYPPLIEGVVKGSGRKVTFGTPIFVPPASTNFASIVAELGSSGSNAILPGLPATQALALYRALSQAGNTLPIAVAPSTYLSQLAQLPSSYTSHLVFVSQFNRSGPTYQAFLQAQKTDGYPQDNVSDESVNAYAALQMFVNLAKGMSHPTRAAIIAAATNLTAYNTGLTQPLNFQAKSKILGGAFARLTNTQVYYYKVAGNTLRAHQRRACLRRGSGALGGVASSGTWPALQSE